MAAFLIATASASGCVLLAVPGGFEVAVQNESGDAVVAEVQLARLEGLASRFYPIKAGGLLVVDTVGHNNGPPESVVIRDRSCTQIATVRGNLTEGALIVVSGTATARVVPGRDATADRTGGDLAYGEPTCESAAAKLVD